MKSDNEIFDLLDRNSKNQLLDSEKNELESMLVNDDELKQLAQLHIQTQEVILNHKLLQISDLIKKESSGGSNLKSWTVFVGILLVASVAGYVLFDINKTKSSSIEIVSSKTENVKILPSQKETTNPSKDLSVVVKKENSQINNTVETQIENKNKNTESITQNVGQNIPETSQKLISTVQTVEILPEKQSLKPKKVSCNDVHIDSKISTKPTCAGESKGSVVVSSTKGGLEPYQFTVYDQVQNPLPSLENLEEGVYSLKIHDQIGCETVIQNIIIKGNFCAQEYVMNVEIGEKWDVPVTKQSKELYIYSKNGKLVYKSEIEANQEHSWDGRLSSGEMGAGVYVYKLIFSDQSVAQNHITILH
ncbi:MAG: hypothetical protein U0V72_14060 [Cytophagales bacterium]